MMKIFSTKNNQAMRS